MLNSAEAPRVYVRARLRPAFFDYFVDKNVWVCWSGEKNYKLKKKAFIFQFGYDLIREALKKLQSTQKINKIGEMKCICIRGFIMRVIKK